MTLPMTSVHAFLLSVCGEISRVGSTWSLFACFCPDVVQCLSRCAVVVHRKAGHIAEHSSICTAQLASTAFSWQLEDTQPYNPDQPVSLYNLS